MFCCSFNRLKISSWNIKYIMQRADLIDGEMVFSPGQQVKVLTKYSCRFTESFMRCELCMRVVAPPRGAE